MSQWNYASYAMRDEWVQMISPQESCPLYWGLRPKKVELARMLFTTGRGNSIQKPRQADMRQEQGFLKDVIEEQR